MARSARRGCDAAVWRESAPSRRCGPPILGPPSHHPLHYAVRRAGRASGQSVTEPWERGRPRSLSSYGDLLRAGGAAPEHLLSPSDAYESSGSERVGYRGSARPLHIPKLLFSYNRKFPQGNNTLMVSFSLSPDNNNNTPFFTYAALLSCSQRHPGSAERGPLWGRSVRSW